MGFCSPASAGGDGSKKGIQETPRGMSKGTNEDPRSAVSCSPLWAAQPRWWEVGTTWNIRACKTGRRTPLAR